MDRLRQKLGAIYQRKNTETTDFPPSIINQKHMEDILSTSCMTETILQRDTARIGKNLGCKTAFEMCACGQKGEGYTICTISSLLTDILESYQSTVFQSFQISDAPSFEIYVASMKVEFRKSSEILKAKQQTWGQFAKKTIEQSPGGLLKRNIFKQMT